MSNNYVTIDVGLETKKFDKQIEYVKQQIEEVEYLLKKADLGEDVGDIGKLEAKYEKLKNTLVDLETKKRKAFETSQAAQNISEIAEKAKEASYSLDKVDTSTESINKHLNKTTTSIGNVIKKVTKWGLAVFGIRAAYNFVRQSVSILSSQNEQMAADIEYIRYALASTLQPVIEFIIKLVYQLLSLIGSIIKTLTGKNIFENANKGLDQANKSAKELKKQLAGFDEMNVLTDSSSDAGGGTVKPSFDLSDLENADVSGIYSWIDKVKGVFNTGFDEIKENVKNVMGDLGFSKEFIGTWEFAVDGVKLAFDGLFDTTSGVLEMITGLATGDSTKVKEGFGIAIKGIGEMFLGLLKIILGVFGMILTGLYDIFIRPAAEKIGNFISGIIEKINGVISKINEKFSILGSKLGEIFGEGFKGAINAVFTIIERMLNYPIKAINGLLKLVNKLPGVKISTISTFKLPRLAKGGIINMPGKGVPVGSAIGGERGQEGVIPLTDSQQMDLLGQAIARHMVVNLTNVNQMDGRVISRAMKKINTESDFAFNR